MVFKSTTITAEDVEKVVTIVNQLEVGFEVRPEDVELSTFDSGAISNIYKVSFRSSAPARQKLPSTVVVKLYQVNEKLPYCVTRSQLANLVIGQAGLSPKVLLVLKQEAIVWEYLGPGARELTAEDDFNLAIREKIARQLARFHALEPPVPRNRRRIIAANVFDHWFEESWLEAVKTDGHPLNEAAKRLNCSNLLNFSVEEIVAEMQLVKRLILGLEESSSSKIVFSHGDFNHSNIMLRGGSDEEEVPEILFLDFDFSAYFYRGFDIGHYFNDATQVESYDDNELISDAEMRDFVRWYLEEASGDSKTVDPEELEALLKESKLFVLFTHWVGFIFCLFTAWIKFETDLPKAEEFLNFVEQRFRGYLRSKRRFVEDGSIDPKSC